MKSWCCKVDGAGEADTTKVCAAPQQAPPAGFIWCHLDGKTGEEREWLTGDSGLPESVVLALTAIETRPRCDAVADGALINLRGLGATRDDDGDELVSIRLFAQKGRVISVTFRTLEATATIRAKMEDGAIKDPGDLIAALAVAITEELDPKIAALGDEVDECEADLSAEKAFAMRGIIARARSAAIGYRRFVVPQREALQRLAGFDGEWLEEDDRLHLHEASDRFARMAEELEAVRERSALLHEQLTDLRAEQIEQRTLLLSVAAMVFLPLTFITGLFGMNYPFPFESEHWPFFAVLGFCVVVTVGVLGYFKRAGWFG